MTHSKNESDGCVAGLESVETDALLDVFTSNCRRTILSILGECGPNTSLDELAARMAAQSEGPNCGVEPPQLVERFKTIVHHVHLPKLDDAGVVEYDPDRTTVELAVDSRRLARLLDVVQTL